MRGGTARFPPARLLALLPRKYLEGLFLHVLGHCPLYPPGTGDLPAVRNGRCLSPRARAFKKLYFCEARVLCLSIFEWPPFFPISARPSALVRASRSKRFFLARRILLRHMVWHGLLRPPPPLSSTTHRRFSLLLALPLASACRRAIIDDGGGGCAFWQCWFLWTLTKLWASVRASLERFH